MSNRDARYTLKGTIEMDEGYFTVVASKVEHSKGKLCRAAAGKANVPVMAESIPLENITTGKSSNQVRYFKAKVLRLIKQMRSIRTTMGAAIEDKTILFTNKSISYVDIADYIELHITEKSSKNTTK